MLLRASVSRRIDRSLSSSLLPLPLTLFLSSAFAFSLSVRLRHALTTRAMSPSASVSASPSLASLVFDNRNLRSLPVDASGDRESRAVPGAVFSRVAPLPVDRPQVVAVSREALSLLGIDLPNNSDGDYLPADLEREIAEYLSGNRLLVGSEPAAHCYAGHQFGGFSGQLGDGAAISLGEVLVSNTPTQTLTQTESEPRRVEVQLKGAGTTPYSRGSDGRKVLRSSIREFLCSEAMHALNIPTTRALACVTSDSTVARDPFYNGQVVQERCTVVTRLSPHFFRIGSLEIFKERERAGQRVGPSAGNAALKTQLLSHLLRVYFPQCCGDGDEGESGVSPSPAAVLCLFREVSRRTARLVSLWQSVGFTHGVLNTDNLSLAGVTIDYGPFGFVEMFDEQYVPNGSDHSARYAYTQQPAICAWNLNKLAEALRPLLSPQDAQNAIAQDYHAVYEREYALRMREKLGLCAHKANNGGYNDIHDERRAEDAALVRALLQCMRASFADYTDSFAAISLFLRSLADSLSTLSSSPTDTDAETHTETEKEDVWTAERERLIARLVRRSASPTNVVNYYRRKLRIHKLSMPPQQTEQLHALLQRESRERLREIFGGAGNADIDVEAIAEEIASEKRTLSLLIEASQAIEKFEKRTPSADEKAASDRERWTQWVDMYIARLRAEIAATESVSAAALLAERASTAEAVNPTLILRNWMAQEAIAFAEKGDLSYVRALQTMLTQPFAKKYSTFLQNDDQLQCSPAAAKNSKTVEREELSLSEKEKFFVRLPPDWADSLLCTCSS